MKRMHFQYREALRRPCFPCRKLACVILAASLTTPVRGQPLEPAFEHITIGVAYSFLHDSNGFLWIGAQEGLARYDGYNLKFYKHIPFDSTSLSSNWVTVLKEDRDGNLWVGTWGGALNYFNQRTDKFTRYLQDPDSSSSINCRNICSIVVNDDGTLWIGTQERGLLRMSFDGNGNAVYRRCDLRAAREANNDEREVSVWCLLKDSEGILWVGTFGNGLICLDPATNERRHYEHDPGKPASLSSNSISCLCEDDSGNIWIGTGNGALSIKGNGLSRFDRKTRNFTTFKHSPLDPTSLCSNSPLCLLIDHANTLWVGTSDNGLCSIELKHLYGSGKPVFARRKNVGGTMIHSVYEDRLDNIWVGLLAMHVCRYDGHRNPFIWYRHVPGNRNSLSGNAVACIYVDRKDKIWFGYNWSGVTRFDPRSGAYKHFACDPKSPTGISSNWVNAICEGNDGIMWLGTSDSGIDVFNPSDDTFTHLKADPDRPSGLRSNRVRFLLKSRSDDIWISTVSEGLQLYDQESRTFTFFDVDSSTSADEATSILYEDSRGTLWIGTMNNGVYGLTVADREIKSVKHYVHDPRNKNSLSYNHTTDIIQSRVLDNDALWIATSVGLNRLDLKTETFTHYFAKDGLPHDFVLKLLEDNEGNIWASTAYKLCVFSVRTGKFSSYGKNDGLPVTGFAGARQNSAVTRDHQLLFGAAYGVLGYHPEEVLRNQAIPHIFLTDFRIWHESVKLDTAIHVKRVITLEHDENTFGFDFSDLNLTTSKRNQFAYKLEGLYEDWIYIGNEHTVSFTNIDPGTYSFRVKASDNDSTWSKGEASLSIVITPPWWKTTWAYLVYVVIIGTILSAGYRVRMRRMQLAQQLQIEHLEAEKMRDVNRMKSRFFANISHEFRTPLTLVLGPIHKWREKAHEEGEKKDLGVAERNARRVLRLINQLLDLSRLEAGGMRLRASRMNIVPLVKGIAYSFATVDGRGGVGLTVDVEEKEIEVYCDGEVLERILNNLLSNAFKFTPKGGSVTCTLKRKNVSSHEGTIEVAEINVSDTGVGIPREQLDRVFDRFYQVDASQTRAHEGSGIGLALVKELVELHHGTIHVQSKVGKGSIFSIQMRLGRNHLTDDEIVEVPEGVEMAVRESEAGVGCEAAEEPMEGRGSEGEKSGKPIVLVVEDHADVRAYIKGHLVPAYQVREARDGAEGIEKAQEIIPDLVISDVMMPKKDGFEVCRILKCDVRTSHIPIVLLTAKAASEDKIEGLEIGADDYLIKPFEPKELLARVKNLIDQRQKLRERFAASAPLRPGEVAVTSMDDAFLNKVIVAVELHMGDEHLSIEGLGAEVGMSRVQLHRKLVALTNLSPGEFIRYFRLHRAMELLQKDTGTVSEIAYAVGFNDPSYFSKCFHKQFGKAPSEVRNASIQAENPGKAL